MKQESSNKPIKLDWHERIATHKNFDSTGQKIALEYLATLRLIASNTGFVIGETFHFTAFLFNKANQKAELDIQMLKELISRVELDPKTITELRVKEESYIKAAEENIAKDKAIEKTRQAYVKIFENREANDGRYVNSKGIEK